jgi:hypothetical protein
MERVNPNALLEHVDINAPMASVDLNTLLTAVDVDLLPRISTSARSYAAPASPTSSRRAPTP